MRLFAALPLFVTLSLAAQTAEPPPPPRDPNAFTLSVKTRLVNVTAVVRNSSGAVIRDLKQEDFVLREDGKVVPIKYFNVDNDLPLTLGLMVDTSLSQKRYAEQERVASRAFLHRMITRPQDRAYLERFDWHAMQLASLTPNLMKLDIGLGGLLDAPGAPPQPAGTVIWDALIATADQIFGKEPGRRAIIIMTDGEDVGSKSSLQDAINVIKLYDLPVYTILYTEKVTGYLGPMDPNLRAQGLAAKGPFSMEVLSQASGGRTFAVSPSMPIDKIFAAIEDDLRSEYRMSFTPANTPAGTRHTLELKIKKGHYTIQSRNGYFTQP